MTAICPGHFSFLVQKWMWTRVGFYMQRASERTWADGITYKVNMRAPNNFSGVRRKQNWANSGSCPNALLLYFGVGWHAAARSAALQGPEKRPIPTKSKVHIHKTRASERVRGFWCECRERRTHLTNCSFLYARTTTFHTPNEIIKIWIIYEVVRPQCSPERRLLVFIFAQADAV